MTENHYFIGSERHELDSSGSIEALVQRLRQYLELRHVSVLVGNGCSIPLGAPSIGSVRSIEPELSVDPFRLRNPEEQHAAVELLRLLLGDTVQIGVEPLLALLANLRANHALLPGVAQHVASWPVQVTAVDALERLLKKWLWIRCSSLSSVADTPLADHEELFRRLLLRSTGLPRAKVFTTHYDLVIERALDSLGIMYFDGFLGTIQRSLRTESYHYDLYFPGETTEGRVSRVDRVLHLYKLHGSINWRRAGPANIDVVSNNSWPDDSEVREVMVYPSPLKLTEMNGYPYAEMLRHFSACMNRPQTVLFTIGYSFRDDHINRLIYQALAIPSFVLVIVVPEMPAPGDPSLLGPEHELWRLVNRVSSKRVVTILGGTPGPNGTYESGAGTLRGFANQLMPDIGELNVRRVVADELARAVAPDKSDAPIGDEV